MGSPISSSTGSSMCFYSAGPLALPCVQELSTGSSILLHSHTGKRLGWIPVVEDKGRRRKEGSGLFLTGRGGAEEPCLVQKLGGVRSRGTFNSTGTHSSSVPRVWDPHLFDLVWSLDVLLHKGTGKCPRQGYVGMKTEPTRTIVRVSSRQ